VKIGPHPRGHPSLDLDSRNLKCPKTYSPYRSHPFLPPPSFLPPLPPTMASSSRANISMEGSVPGQNTLVAMSSFPYPSSFRNNSARVGPGACATQVTIRKLTRK
jgi:hypothetical protein